MKPFILITNDDGINSKGISVLTRLMLQIGDVTVVAPDSVRSAQSNAITISQPITFQTVEESDSLKRYQCSGTPTDCVKLALGTICTRKPDLLVSGINHGSNAAIAVIYSGTMGAVLEGCENGIPSIGFSISDYEADADFSRFEKYIVEISRKIIESPLPYGYCLNVNCPKGEIKGVKICRQCKGLWVKEFEKRTHPFGTPYYWMTGEFENLEPQSSDTDEWALNNGYISIVPTKIDMTAYEICEEVEKLMC
ncbi:MAG: 5'/3'-nucleotidase SurE [Paludibacter sp.]|jgi:5'-nucleotidase|nr:5'/3'-nucleotidase SurE [Paludibacter sp.]